MFLSCALCLVSGLWPWDGAYPPSRTVDAADTLHGQVVADPYRWLETPTEEVAAWVRAQQHLSKGVLERLPQRAWILSRLEQLSRADMVSLPTLVPHSPRLFWWVRRATDDRYRLAVQEEPGAPMRDLIDSNAWPPEETLEFAIPSRDGRLLAVGRARAGNEDPEVFVMEVDTGRILPDTLLGRQRGGIEWLPDGTGFFYSAKPRRGEVPEGEEHYWHSVYLHRLGTPSAQDRRILWDDRVKECYHGVSVSHDGRWLLSFRYKGGKNEVFMSPLEDPPRRIPVAEGFHGEYQVDILGETVVILTDERASRREVYVAPLSHPSREHWRLLISESEAILTGVQGIGGLLYVTSLHQASTRIQVFDLEGVLRGEVALPALGSAHVTGQWHRPEAYVSFTSFACPATVYSLDGFSGRLTLLHSPHVPLDPEDFRVELVWYRSTDGTPVSMFLFSVRRWQKPGPVLLTGYGGFNIPLTPFYAAGYVAWAEAGGMVAIPHLRGGGEYGREWHEAGRKERKQQVFDDFIAAAEWLQAQGYTSADRLAISGGSNGGLLVGAVTMQRPELFSAVLCQVPLLDMIRYHKFGLANIWAEEYGSADDPSQFQALLRYSPYHRVKPNAWYPPMLFVASDHDARVDPLHARKMVARLQAEAQGGPFLLVVQEDSGHGGGTTLSRRLRQQADQWAFLMQAVGMRPQEGGGLTDPAGSP